ncbi:MAG: preprotein translocase subunit SecG [Lachnospiraceae bacterium]|nr:preprotein translocase subunit SecG [Lachnospiraceae bacterium]
MSVLRIILTVLLILDCIVVSVIILMQEGKQVGLGAMAGGSADSYWSKNKSRSMEGKLVTLTRVLVVLFFLISILLNLKVI